ncbi:hypothetical protein BDP55DRAFT_293977 [Colletotrichum godetiae]|uniref:Uncharacterized protein n=1 Tax=Colletotrichum godetiae TaxID=1209918 RepID=A0AAJ0ETL1_9PEZI|nr:uncharacterized protein BDP55DRAFT_293977 [Colletotrichum godetiae]KAK1671395.1 hypothetical protein BDP55DRAFT_293977 [Colletotrichum godetiae]
MGRAPPSGKSGDGFVRITVPAPNVDQDEGRLPRVMIDVKPLAMVRAEPKKTPLRCGRRWNLEGPRGEDHVRATAFTAAAEVPNKATAAEQADLGGPIRGSRMTVGYSRRLYSEEGLERLGGGCSLQYPCNFGLVCLSSFFLFLRHSCCALDSSRMNQRACLAAFEQQVGEYAAIRHHDSKINQFDRGNPDGPICCSRCPVPSITEEGQSVHAAAATE